MTYKETAVFNKWLGNTQEWKKNIIWNINKQISKTVNIKESVWAFATKILILAWSFTKRKCCLKEP